MPISTINTNSISNAAVTPDKAATLMLPLGVGQTWQNMTGSRAAGTTYTNTTGRPIMVSVRTEINANATATIGGITATWSDNSGSNRGGMTFIVPNGVTYVVNSIGPTNNWSELR